MNPDQEYAELVSAAWDIGFAHGLADHSLSDMMLSVERAVGRTVPVDVWLDLFAGREAGLRERAVARPAAEIDWTGIPL